MANPANQLQQSNAQIKKAETNDNCKWLNHCTFRHNLKSQFCYILSGTSGFSSWGKKKSFCIQTYLQNANIKCVNIYI